MEYNMPYQTQKEVSMADGDKFIKTWLQKLDGGVRCDEAEIDTIINDKPIAELKPNISKTTYFVPHDFGYQFQDMDTALLLHLQIVVENIDRENIKVSFTTQSLDSALYDIFNKLAQNIMNANFETNNIADLDEDVIDATDLLVGVNLFTDQENIANISNILPKNAFLLTLEEKLCNLFKSKSFVIISKISINGKILALLRKASTDYQHATYIQTSQDVYFTWISNMQRDLKRNKKVILVSERHPHCGLRDFVVEMKKAYKNQIGLIEVDDYHIPPFDPENNIFKKQLEKNLTFNILKKGQWGGFYYFQSSNSQNSDQRP